MCKIIHIKVLGFSFISFANFENCLTGHNSKKLLLTRLKKQDPFHIPLLLIYVYAANSALFFKIPAYPVWEYSLLFNMLKLHQIEVSGSIVVSAVLFFTLVQALVLNRSFVKFKLVEQPHQLLSFVFITLTGLFPAVIMPSPAYISTFFVLIVFHNMLSLFDMENAVQRNFFSAFYLTVGGMIYTPVLSLFVLLLIASFILKAPKIREIIILPMGILVPLFLFLFVFYFTGNLDELPNYTQNLIPEIQIRFKGEFTLYFIPAFMIILILFIGFFQNAFIYVHKSVRSSRYNQFFVVYFIFLVLIFVFTSVDKFTFGTFFLIPISIFLTSTFSFENDRLNNYFALILIVLLILMQYLYYLEKIHFSIS